MVSALILNMGILGGAATICIYNVVDLTIK